MLTDQAEVEVFLEMEAWRLSFSLFDYFLLFSLLNYFQTDADIYSCHDGWMSGNFWFLAFQRL